ncbi:hypothetical protein [Anaerotalea alkaliphila]|nr:hypothetical protein [Anaerotalea alkaliphila]
MGRMRRVWYPGAMYHIITRGNHLGFFPNNRRERYRKFVEGGE